MSIVLRRTLIPDRKRKRAPHLFPFFLSATSFLSRHAKCSHIPAILAKFSWYQGLCQYNSWRAQMLQPPFYLLSFFCFRPPPPLFSVPPGRPMNWNLKSQRMLLVWLGINFVVGFRLENRLVFPIYYIRLMHVRVYISQNLVYFLEVLLVGVHVYLQVVGTLPTNKGKPWGLFRTWSAPYR